MFFLQVKSGIESPLIELTRFGKGGRQIGSSERSPPRLGALIKSSGLRKIGEKNCPGSCINVSVLKKRFITHLGYMVASQCSYGCLS